MQTTPRWITNVLLAAGLYNLLWGTFVIMFPGAMFAWFGMEPPNYPELWQCIGMIVGVYGIGYAIAAFDPARHWPIVLVGFLGKLFGPIGFLSSALRGDLPWAFGWLNVTNDLVWMGPFIAILYHAFRVNTEPARQAEHSLQEVLTTHHSQLGHTLAELSASQLVLVIFLRHAGCTFCREALHDAAEDRAAIENAGVKLAFVHMGSEAAQRGMFAGYGLDDVDRFSDPACEIYRAFDLPRGRFAQLLGPSIWWRGFFTAIIRGHGFGRLVGDGFQMPGVFLLENSRIIAEYRHQTAADRPDYAGLVWGKLPACHTSSKTLAS